MRIRPFPGSRSVTATALIVLLFLLAPLPAIPAAQLAPDPEVEGAGEAPQPVAARRPRPGRRRALRRV